MLLKLNGTREAIPLLNTPSNERNAEISPDGRWLAYESDESGQFEVYVRPFPAVESGRWAVSAGGGRQPLWARTGRELFYRSPDGAVMGVAVASDDRGGSFGSSTPTRLLEGRYWAGGGTTVGRSYDVSPDGQRFLMIKEGSRDGPDAGPGIVIVQHWGEELKRLVPTN